MLKHSVYNYFTLWSFIISFSVFFISYIKKIPVWLFLTACCLVITSSIIGTLFYTVPKIKNNDTVFETVTDVLGDIMCHILPLLFVIFMFKNLSKNVYDVKNSFSYSLILSALLVFIYLSIVNPIEIYENDIPETLIVLIYIASYVFFYNRFLSLKKTH